MSTPSSSFSQPVSLRVEKATSKFIPSLLTKNSKRSTIKQQTKPKESTLSTQQQTDLAIGIKKEKQQQQQSSSITKLSMYSSQPTHHLIEYEEKQKLPQDLPKLPAPPPSSQLATKIIRPTERQPVVTAVGYKTTKLQTKQERAEGSEDDQFDKMNPMEITDQPIASFIKNIRHGKRMTQKVEEEERIIRPSPQQRQSQSQLEQPSSTTIKASGPKVRLLEGKIVVDEDSLLLRQTGENGDQLSSVILNESQIRVTSASFRKGGRVGGVGTNGKRERWTQQETKLFYSALSVCGLDFWLITELLGGKRSHKQVKNKFILEERKNPQLINQLLTERKPLTESVLKEFKSNEELQQYEEKSK